MSGGVRKCKRCNTYSASDEVCHCWEVPPNSKLVEDFDIPVLPDFSKKDGGTKYDFDKPAMGLIPQKALEEEGKVWGFGAKKYGTHNWRKGLSTLRICGAIMRHTAAIMGGQDTDPESGLPHAAHVRCCAAMLIEFIGRSDLDDRHTNG